MKWTNERGHMATANNDDDDGKKKIMKTISNNGFERDFLFYIPFKCIHEGIARSHFCGVNEQQQATAAAISTLIMPKKRELFVRCQNVCLTVENHPVE